MMQIWQDMLQRITSRVANGMEAADMAGKLELMLVRLQAEPARDQADLAFRCIAALPWSIHEPPLHDIQTSCLLRLGRIFNLLGAVEMAETAFHQAMTLASVYSIPRIEAIAHMEIGELARRKGQLTIAQYHQNKALGIGESFSLDTEFADALNNLANVAIESGNLDEAEKLLIRCLEIAERQHEIRLQGHVYNNMGVVKCLRASFPDAISEFARAVPRREQAGDDKGLCETFHNIGLAYLDSGDMTRATEYTMKALDKAQEIRDLFQESHVMLTMMELAEQTGDYPYALSMADQLSLRQESLGDRPGQAETRKLVGRILLKQGRLEEAETALSRAISQFRALGLMPGEAETSKALALCIRELGRIDESRELLLKARTLFNSIGNQPEVDNIDTLMREITR